MVVEWLPVPVVTIGADEVIVTKWPVLLVSPLLVWDGADEVTLVDRPELVCDSAEE